MHTYIYQDINYAQYVGISIHLQFPSLYFLNSTRDFFASDLILSHSLLKISDWHGNLFVNPFFVIESLPPSIRRKTRNISEADFFSTVAVSSIILKVNWIWRHKHSACVFAQCLPWIRRCKKASSVGFVNKIFKLWCIYVSNTHNCEMYIFEDLGFESLPRYKELGISTFSWLIFIFMCCLEKK
jgi:hypothetical protein